MARSVFYATSVCEVAPLARWKFKSWIFFHTLWVKCTKRIGIYGVGGRSKFPALCHPEEAQRSRDLTLSKLDMVTGHKVSGVRCQRTEKLQAIIINFRENQ